MMLQLQLMQSESVVSLKVIILLNWFLKGLSKLAVELLNLKC